MPEIFKPNPDLPGLEPKEKLNEMRLKIFFARLPERATEVLGMSAMEMLESAVQAEDTLRQLPLGDIARERFSQEKYRFETLALYQELREKYLHKFKEAA